MTQIKIFTETTYQGSGAGPGAFKIEQLTQEVNDYLAENEGKIILKDIKYKILSPNPNNIKIKDWVIMLVYDTV